jgi:hypothetical protein
MVYGNFIFGLKVGMPGRELKSSSQRVNFLGGKVNEIFYKNYFLK